MVILHVYICTLAPKFDLRFILMPQERRTEMRPSHAYLVIHLNCGVFLVLLHEIFLSSVVTALSPYLPYPYLGFLVIKLGKSANKRRFRE